jgi:hypothetical protein
VLVLAPATGRMYPPLLATYLSLVLLGELAAAILWLTVDARPLIGLLVAALLYRLGLVTAGAAVPARDLLILLVPWLLLAAVLGAPALWRLRRQTARPGRTTA